MFTIQKRFLAIGVAMFAAAGLAVALTPTDRLADKGPKVDLETLIPESFGDWKIDKSLVPIAVSPDVQARLDRIYSQTLARTYINGNRERVMLSIAYGSNQGSDDFAVHRPEFCYAAQGFQLKGVINDRLALASGFIPIRRLEASQGPRHEPITYWITIGNEATLPGFGRKLAQLRYGLSGKVPDGMLTRVSSIQADTQAAYRLQNRFITDLLAAVDRRQRLELGRSQLACDEARFHVTTTPGRPSPPRPRRV